MTRLEFLGITFDSQTMTMEISQEKMGDILKELQGWLYKTSAKRKEVESLLGKLQFLAKCIKAGRVFLARIIQWIRGMDRKNEHHTQGSLERHRMVGQVCQQVQRGLPPLVTQGATDGLLTSHRRMPRGLWRYHAEPVHQGKVS